jgi:hypothetical protein
MGILDDYLDPDVIDDEPVGFDKPKDGTYEFEIGDASIKKWENKKGEHTSFVIDYYLTDPDDPDRDIPKASDFLTLPDGDTDPEDYTTAEKIALRTLRDRYLALGFAREDFGSIEREDLIGLTGTLTLKTGAKGYQNITQFSADTVAEKEVEEEEKPAPRSSRRQAGQTSAKPKAKAAPEAEAEEDDEPTFRRGSRRRAG